MGRNVPTRIGHGTDVPGPAVNWGVDAELSVRLRPNQRHRDQDQYARNPLGWRRELDDSSEKNYLGKACERKTGGQVWTLPTFNERWLVSQFAPVSAQHGRDRRTYSTDERQPLESDVGRGFARGDCIRAAATNSPNASRHAGSDPRHASTASFPVSPGRYSSSSILVTAGRSPG